MSMAVARLFIDNNDNDEPHSRLSVRQTQTMRERERSEHETMNYSDGRTMSVTDPTRTRSQCKNKRFEQIYRDMSTRTKRQRERERERERRTLIEQFRWICVRRVIYSIVP
jgi:predicted double-glycine peptidase